MKRFQISVALALFTAACAEEVQPPIYQAVAISRRDIVVSASAAGSIEPVTTVEVKSKASGAIIEVAVETGDVVRTGQRLVRVDPRTPRNALTQAEADLEVAQAQLTNARSQFRRAEELFQTRSVTEEEYDAVRLQVANANASLVRAQRSLEDARIAFEDTDVRAPINGIIIQRSVEVGTVISSATSNVGGGTTLLQMANLDTVQIRSLVDETDIGKIQPGMDVTITVDAYPNRPFEGQVLKIEPMAETEQNVTMFPVLVRIANPERLLKPGMNAEVEVHVGERRGVLAIPNASLRTRQDMGSAAAVLGLEFEQVQEQLAAAQQDAGGGGQASMGGTTASDQPATNLYRTRDGREIQLPEGITTAQVDAVFQKMRSGGPQGLSDEDRAVFTRIRSAMGGGRGGSGARSRRHESDNSYLFGGRYIVFVLRDGQPTAVEVQTGLTDLDYSEIRNGLVETDSILILPSASLIEQQEAWRERINRFRGGGLPGVQRQTSGSSNRSSSRGDR